MKKKNAKVAFCILVCIVAFVAGMKAYREVYNKGFHDGVKFTLDEILIISKQQEYGNGNVRGL